MRLRSDSERTVVVPYELQYAAAVGAMLAPKARRAKARRETTAAPAAAKERPARKVHQVPKKAAPKKATSPKGRPPKPKPASRKPPKQPPTKTSTKAPPTTLTGCASMPTAAVNVTQGTTPERSVHDTLAGLLAGIRARQLDPAGAAQQSVAQLQHLFGFVKVWARDIDSEPACGAVLLGTDLPDVCPGPATAGDVTACLLDLAKVLAQRTPDTFVRVCVDTIVPLIQSSAGCMTLSTEARRSVLYEWATARCTDADAALKQLQRVPPFLSDMNWPYWVTSWAHYVRAMAVVFNRAHTDPHTVSTVFTPAADDLQGALSSQRHPPDVMATAARALWEMVNAYGGTAVRIDQDAIMQRVIAAAPYRATTADAQVMNDRIKAWMSASHRWTARDAARLRAEYASATDGDEARKAT